VRRGALGTSVLSPPPSGRSYSVSGFEFDLLPLSASMADPEMVQGENAGEKSVGLINGDAHHLSFTTPWPTLSLFQELR
jgi:hypothetical protein